MKWISEDRNIVVTLCGTCATGLETHNGVPFTSGKRQPQLMALDTKRSSDHRSTRAAVASTWSSAEAVVTTLACAQGNVSSASKRGGLGCGCEEATARWGCDAVYQSAFLDRGGGPRCATRAKTGVRILWRTAKRLRPRPMADGEQHRNETARQAYCPGTVLLDHDGVHSTPLTGAYVWCPCVNPADLPLCLWLRDFATWPSVSVLRRSPILVCHVPCFAINRHNPDCALMSGSSKGCWVGNVVAVKTYNDITWAQCPGVQCRALGI
jgi:hypothetical protein